MKDASARFKQELQRLQGSCQSIRNDLQAVLSTKSDDAVEPVPSKHKQLYHQVQVYLENMTQLESELQKSLHEMHRKTVASPASGMRHLPRYSRRVPLRFKVVGQADEWIPAFTQDIGAMGLFVRCTKSQKKGTALHLDVALPEIGAVALQGQVAWTKWVPPGLRGVQNPGFGVKITQAPEQWFTYFVAQEKA